MNPIARRISYAFLCIVPFLAGTLTAVRALRIPGVYQTIGAVHFAAICIAVWILGSRAISAGTEEKRSFTVAGLLLVAPFALIALLWVGIATPWDAAPAENKLRYLVLLVGAIAVTAGFVVLREALGMAGERFYSTLGFAANLLAGAAYVIWTSFQVGAYVVRIHEGQLPPAIDSMSAVFDILLFVACVLTYLTTAAFAISMGRAHLLGHGATRVYVIASFLALLFILLRGLSFPDPTAGPFPWYVGPGFFAGVPSVPWILPFLLGVVLLHRASEDPRPTDPSSHPNPSHLSGMQVTTSSAAKC